MKWIQSLLSRNKEKTEKEENVLLLVLAVVVYYEDIIEFKRKYGAANSEKIMEAFKTTMAIESTITSQAYDAFKQIVSEEGRIRMTEEMAEQAFAFADRVNSKSFYKGH